MLCSGLHLGLHESRLQPCQSHTITTPAASPYTKKNSQIFIQLLDFIDFATWSHLGLNQGPPDYESGATNQLSYGTVPLCITKTVIFNWSANIVIFFNPICFSAKNYFHFAVIASVNRKPHEQERRRA